MEKPLRITIRLDDFTYDKLKAYTRENRLSMSEGIRAMIHTHSGNKLRYISREDIEKAFESINVIIK